MCVCVCPEKTKEGKGTQRTRPEEREKRKRKQKGWIYLAKEWVDLATKGSDGPVSVAVVGSLGIPVVGVLLLHQGHDLGLEGLHDLGSARRSTSNVSAEKVGRTVDFDKHCVCGYVFSIEGDGGGMECRL